jgi:hypothetical protein
MNRPIAKNRSPAFSSFAVIQQFFSHLNSRMGRCRTLVRRHGLVLQFPILTWIAFASLACTATSTRTTPPISAPIQADPPSRAGRLAPPPAPTIITPTVTPNTTLVLYPVWTRGFLCESNAYYAGNPLLGKTIRFQTPINVNPNKVPRVLEAIRNYEAMTGGLITFRIVDFDPQVGIVFVEGDALDRDGEPGCGHVTSGRDPQSGFAFSVTNDGVVNSCLYIHLGSVKCDPVREGFQCCSIAEHELAHALGLGTHFPGFTGIEGISLELLVTLTALYRVPPGTEVSEMCGTLSFDELEH